MLWLCATSMLQIPTLCPVEVCRNLAVCFEVSNWATSTVIHAFSDTQECGWILQLIRTLTSIRGKGAPGSYTVQWHWIMAGRDAKPQTHVATLRLKKKSADLVKPGPLHGQLPLIKFKPVIIITGIHLIQQYGCFNHALMLPRSFRSPSVKQLLQDRTDIWRNVTI